MKKQTDDPIHPNLQNHRNQTLDGRYKSADTYGSKALMWWAMLYAADDSHTWPVSFDTKKEAIDYVKRKFKEKT